MEVDHHILDVMERQQIFQRRDYRNQLYSPFCPG